MLINRCPTCESANVVKRGVPNQGVALVVLVCVMLLIGYLWLVGSWLAALVILAFVLVLASSIGQQQFMECQDCGAKWK